MTAWKFAVDCPAISSTVAPRTAARLSTTFATNAGSLRLPAKRHGRQIRRIRLDQEPVGRNHPGDVAQIAGFRKRHDAGKRQPGTKVERRARHFHPSR